MSVVCNNFKYSKNLRRLSTIMEHPEFRSFFNDFMKDWNMTRTTLMFMKLYEGIEKTSKTTLTPFQKIQIMQNIIEDKDLRKQLCEKMLEWQESNIPSINFNDEK